MAFSGFGLEVTFRVLASKFVSFKGSSGDQVEYQEVVGIANGDLFVIRSNTDLAKSFEVGKEYTQSVVLGGKDARITLPTVRLK